MLKNKIVVKKVRNIIILFMALIIMIGAYKNIKDSRAENVVELTAIALDNYGYLEQEEFLLEAKEIGSGLYEIEIPENINSKKVNQVIQMTIGDEVLEIKDNKIQITEEQLDNTKISIEVAYDMAILEQNSNGEYNKILLAEKSEEERKQIQVTEETETLYSKILRYEDEKNGKLVEVKGYFPSDAQLHVEEVSKEKLKEIFGEAKIDVAYDIKIVLQVVSQLPADELDPNSKIEEIVETIEINPEDYGEVCEVLIKDSKIEENSQVYHVKEDNTYEQVNVKDTTKENISFEAQTFSVYAVSADEGIMKASSINNSTDNAGTYSISTNGLLRHYDGNNNTGNGHQAQLTTWKDLSGHQDGTISGTNSFGTDYLTLDGNDDWVNLGQVTASNALTLEVQLSPVTIQSGGIYVLGNWQYGGGGIKLNNGIPYVEFYINGAYSSVRSNEALGAGTIHTISATYNGTSIKLYVDGVLKGETQASGTIGTPENNTVMAIGVNPKGSSVSFEADESYANIKVYSVRIYNKALTQTEINGNLDDTEAPTIAIESNNIKTTGLLRNYSANNNTGSGHDTKLTIWKDLAGKQDGTIKGTSAFADNYITLDGVDDWVNLGQVSLTNAATFDATIQLNTIQSGQVCILVNWQTGGAGIALEDGFPQFTVYTNGAYQTIKLDTKLTTGVIYNITGTYDGSSIKLYVDGVLKGERQVSGTIGTPEDNTVMAIGANPAGTSSEGGHPNIKVYSARVYNTALTQEEIIKNMNQAWAKTHGATVYIRDSLRGLASGGSVKYGWSTSSSTAPSNYTTVSLNNSAGATSTSFTVNGSGLTGKYYLWVTPVTLKDTEANSQTTSKKSASTFWFDNTAPTVVEPTMTKVTSGTAYTSNTWTNENVKITLNNGTDSHSGHKSTTYSIDGGSAQTGETTISSSGTHTLKVTTTDQAENTATAEYTIKIDKTAPTAGTLTMKLGSSSGSNYSNDTWTNQSVYIYANAGSDSDSGHSSTSYSINRRNSKRNWNI